MSVTPRMCPQCGAQMTPGHFGPIASGVKPEDRGRTKYALYLTVSKPRATVTASSLKFWACPDCHTGLFALPPTINLTGSSDEAG